MSFAKRNAAGPVSKRISVAGVAVLGAGLALSPGLLVSQALAAAPNTIPLSGTAGVVCTISVVPDANATNLQISTSGLQTPVVGTVAQNCNKTAGYTLGITSTNCATLPSGPPVGSVGAKLIETVAGNSYLTYSVAAAQPTTGGSVASVSGLLASACPQNFRDVTGSVVTSETSTLSVSFTGNPLLATGTYTDTLTVSLTIK